ncbi:P-loop NTPase fold protein [Prevotella sp. AM34-19LB]|uniref:P-loop NTPase fold protein n=1 Tax=Prevotella sp. AM34-19LB TaxID=2292364 RepID=UPI001F452149|nr:P-loop NTPase fold protein [Prevotella sp. AM34-19LB]
MNKIPFEYGSIAENEYFIDRIEDRRDLKTFLGGGINVMLISPRRWGKSSLVKAAMEELKQEQKDVRVCYLDAFKIFSEEEFYNKFASAVLQGVSSTMEKRWADIVKFVQSISPSLTINSDPVNAVEVNLNFKPLKESAEEILNLPEKIAKLKASMSSCALMSSNNWQTCPIGSA